MRTWNDDAIVHGRSHGLCVGAEPFAIVRLNLYCKSVELYCSSASVDQLEADGGGLLEEGSRVAECGETDSPRHFPPRCDSTP